MYSLADQAGVLLTNSVLILRSFKALFDEANAKISGKEIVSAMTGWSCPCPLNLDVIWSKQPLD